ncbi:MAG: S-layer homology domain-containing protein [Ruminococcaceae bacterium]|nr:S-layer homology domain-containing protein [Oscillospiraceae bacterium]
MESRFFSLLVVAVLIFSTVPCFAETTIFEIVGSQGGSELLDKVHQQQQGEAIVSDEALTFEERIVKIQDGAAMIQEQKASGSVERSLLITLKNDIYNLESASENVALTESVLSILTEALNAAEASISGLDNASEVSVAIMLARNYYNLEGGKEALEEYNKDSYLGKQEETEFSPVVWSPPVGTSVTGTTATPAEQEWQEYQDSLNEYFEGGMQSEQNNAALVNGFCDVQPSDWYYNQVQAMVKKGLFAGKGDIIDGIGTFAPDDTMTKAEFVTVVARMICTDDEMNRVAEGSLWWDKYYSICLKKRIFSGAELFHNTMSEGMTREEMALVVSRAKAWTKQSGDYSVSYYNLDAATGVIPDYNQVGEYYKYFVTAAYADGLISGMDEAGTFAPGKTLTRAEASTVLYRLLESSARQKNWRLLFSKQPLLTEAVVDITSTAPIVIREGGETLRRPAREGDTVITADGTAVVLKKGPNGILGEGQHVAADLGMRTIDGMDIGYTVLDSNRIRNPFRAPVAIQDSTGTDLINRTYHVNAITGEGHWYPEWQVIQSATKPSYGGSFDDQLTPDRNWLWDTTLNEWGFVPFVGFEKAGSLERVLRVNGLK